MFFEIGILAASIWSLGRSLSTRKGVENHGQAAEPDNSKQTEDRRKRPTTFIEDMDAAYQDFIRRRIDPLFGGARERHLKELSSEQQLSEDEKQINRRLGVASATLGAASLGMAVSTPLLLGSLPGLIYLSVSHYKAACHALFEEKRITIAVLDSILITLGVLSGYWVAGALSGFLFTGSRKLLARTRDDSQKRLIDVFGAQIQSVWVLVEGVEVEKPFDRLCAGDVVVVNAGEMIPADGTIIQGLASIDQHILTGEAQPAEKRVNDPVFASTVVLSGRIHILTERAGSETVAAKIAEILYHTTEYRTSYEEKAELILDRTTVPTLVLSALAYPIAGASGAMGVLLSGVGYNMRILAPLSTLNYLTIASREGLLIKDGSALEGLTRVDTVVFDKTGTLTLEQPKVQHLHCMNGFGEGELLRFAATAEYRQSHPIAQAILAAARQQGLEPFSVEESRYEIGYGIHVSIGRHLVRVGSRRFMETEGIRLTDASVALQAEAEKKGNSLVWVAVDQSIAGSVELHPSVRPGAKKVIENLRKRKVSTCIISGDRAQPTQALAWKLGIDRVFADALPEEKADIVDQLRRQGRTVCFVGDGINDAIALKKADVSISLRGAASAATDTAQIVLMDGHLDAVTHLLNIADDFKKNQKHNMAISVIPGVATIGGVFLLGLGIYFSTVLFFGGLGMGLHNAMLPVTRPQTYKEKEAC